MDLRPALLAGSRQCLELMLQHGMRFTPVLAPDYYKKVSILLEEDDGTHDVKHLNHLLYWMVQFGMPLGVPFPMQDECTRHDAHWDMGNCTFLEKLIMVTATSTDKWTPRMVTLNYGNAVEYYVRIPQSRRITAMRYLIAEGSPVPAPVVFRRLLNNSALPTLFAVLFVMFRTGRKVVLPKFYSSSNAPAKLRPVFFRKVAQLAYELIRRCSPDSCPRSFLNELQRIGRVVLPSKVETLGDLAFRALRRNISSAFSPCRLPRITLDNHDELASEPSWREIHLPPTNSFLPPGFAAKFNLTDLMDQYKASVTEAGLTDLVWL